MPTKELSFWYLEGCDTRVPSQETKVVPLIIITIIFKKKKNNNNSKRVIIILIRIRFTLRAACCDN